MQQLSLKIKEQDLDEPRSVKADELTVRDMKTKHVSEQKDLNYSRSISPSHSQTAWEL